MKKTIPMILAAATALPFSANVLAEGPIDGKVYGKINAAMISTDNAGTSDTALESNASRFGFKGKTALESGISMIYQLEYEINPTEKTASTTIFKQRNAFVGLGTEAAGTVMLGIHDTPLKLAQGKIDQFNDLPVGDIKNLMNGEVRATDVVVYASPSFNGLSLLAAITQYEDADEGKDDGSSVSLSYKIDKLYVSAAIDSEVAGNDVTRVAAQYTMGNLTVGAMLNDSEPSAGGTSTDSTLVSASYKINNIKLKAQVGSGDEKGKGGDLTGFGVDYKLGKKSKAYIYTASYKNDTGTDKSATGVGIEHKF